MPRFSFYLCGTIARWRFVNTFWRSMVPGNPPHSSHASSTHARTSTEFFCSQFFLTENCQAKCQWQWIQESLLMFGWRAMVAFLPSATKLRRLCFYTCLSVILFTGGEYLGRYPPAGTPPRGRYTPQAGTPRAGTPLRQVHPPWGRYPPGRYHHPREMATVADSTHPTGMHSFFVNFFEWTS